MTKRTKSSLGWLCYFGVRLCLLGTLLTSLGAQVPVVISPVPKLQFFDASGRPLAFGCVFSYSSGTTNPLATYTDATGTVQNSDPVILDAGGRAGSGSTGIWLAAGQAYTLKVKSAGGTNCASGSTLYTVDGIGGGLTLLTTLVTCNTVCSFPIASQIQLFKVSLTGNAVAQPLTAVGIIPPALVIFEITQDAAGGHSFTWPANLTGGAPVGSGSNQVTEQFFYWNGANALALGPAVTGTGPALSFDTARMTGQLTSVLATGTAPFVIASTTQVANLNVSLLEGGTWQIPGTIGSTTPNTGKFTTLEATTSFKLNGSQPQTGISGGGTNTSLLSNSTITGTGVQLCTDAAGGATTVCSSSGPTFAPQRVELGAPFSLTAGAQGTVLSESVTFPAMAGTYRVLVSYGAWVTPSGAAVNECGAQVVDTTNTRAFAMSGADGNGAVAERGLAASEISSGTYASGATVTFTLKMVCVDNATVNINSSNLTFSPAQKSYLSVTPLLSN